MSEMMDDIAYLSQEIGPRPAGTEEEQQAAIYISNAFKKRAGLSAQIEDFACNSKPELVNLILCALPIILSIAAMIRNIVVLPAILVGLICALFYVLEAIDKPLLSKAFSRGVSQNVVAKYQPATQAGQRTRKVVIVANYDSGKIRREYGAVRILPFIQKASLFAIVAIPVIWVLRAIFALSASGTALIIWNVVTCVLLVLAAIPIVLFILHQTAQYNEAANHNASSVAAMIEVANRIAHTPSPSTPASEPVVHGKGAALAEDLIPQGAEVVYNVEPTVMTSEDTVSDPSVAEQEFNQSSAVEEDDSQVQDFVFFDDEYGWPQEFAFQADQDYSAFEEPSPDVPEWYSQAQKNAHKSQTSEADTSVRRSRFASALDDAVASSQAHYQAVNEAAAAQRAAHLAEAATVASIARDYEIASEEPAVGFEQSHSDSEAPVDARAKAAYDFSEVANLAAVADRAEHADKNAEPQLAERGLRSEEASASVESADVINAVQEEQPVLIDEAPTPVSAVQDGQVSQSGSTTSMAPIDVSDLRESIRQARSQKEDVDTAIETQPEVQPEAQLEAQIEKSVESPAEESIEPPAEENTRVLVDVPEVRMDLPLVEQHQQRAPLANSASDPSLSSQIPRINLDAFGVSTAGNAEITDNKRAALRNMLPSMSGSITLEASIDEPDEPSTVSRTGSFGPVSLSGSIGPVGDELIAGVDPDDIYVDDADDSSYETTTTETGAYAGPGYMEMPESFASRLFGRFRKKDKKDEQSAHEWLGVEDDFNPTEAGAERGDWESFNEENREKYISRRNKEDNIIDDDDLWNGGAFSKVRQVASGIRSKDDAEEPASIPEEQPRRRVVDTSLPLADIITPQIEEETNKIEDFHLKGVDVEVWFVALGSENAGNGGARAFFAEHAEELRGAMIVNLEGLGSGAFTQISSEGTLKQRTASPRLKRFIRKAQQVTGVTFTSAKINWKDSVASIALKRGMKAVTLAGMENGKPAYMGQGDDVMENVEEEVLLRRAGFIEAMIRYM